MMPLSSTSPLRRALPVAVALLLALPFPARGEEPSDVLGALKAALRTEDVGARTHAVLVVSARLAALPEREARRAAVLIRKAMEDEPGRDVRRALVRALSRLRTDAAWVPVLLAALADRDDAVRAEARLVVFGGGNALLATVARLLEEDADPTFRAELLLLLRDRRKADVVPMLLAALEEDHPRVQAAAAEALEAITGAAHGYDAEAWSTWRAAPPAPGPGDGETVTVTEPVAREPERHVTRSLVPDFYGLPLTAKDIVFVLDVSGSVGRGGVERAKRELIDAVERLGSDVNVAALFFAEEVRMWRPEMVPATPANKAELALFLRAIEPGRRTDVFTPLNAGIQIVRRRVDAATAGSVPLREAVTMIVVSDGVETSSNTPPHVVADKLDRLDLQHSVVHAIVLGDGDSRLLHQIATRAGGHYIRAGDARRGR